MPDFCFVVLSDSHVDVRANAQDEYWWNRMLVTSSAEILAAAVDDINARGPDLVVHCGDITNASDTASYRAAAEILSRLDCPFLFVPGNHDTWLPERRRLAGEVFGCSGPPLYRAVEFSGWRLLLADYAYWAYKDGSVHEDYDREEAVDIVMPDFEFAWLQEELSRDAATPTILFTHPALAVRPLYAVSRRPGGEPAAESGISLDDDLCGSGELKAVLQGYSCVKAAFTGHGHWHECIVENGALYCQTAALVEYPNEARFVRVTQDRIDVEVFPLSRGHFAELSYVAEGGNRWPAGRPVDRRFSHCW